MVEGNIKLSILFISIVLIFINVGCASNVTQVESKPAVSNVETGNDVYFEIVAGNNISENKHYQPTVEKLKNTIMDKLKVADSSVTFPGGEQSNSGLLVRVIVKDFRYVSGGARLLTGIMSGKARLTMLVRLKDLKTGEIVNESELGTASELKHGIFGGTTSRQVGAMSEKIVSMIVSL